MTTQEIIAVLVQQITNQFPQYPEINSAENWVLSRSVEVRPPYQTEFYQCMGNFGLDPLGVIAKIRLSADRSQIHEIELLDVNQGIDTYRRFLEGMFGTNLDVLRKQDGDDDDE